MTYREDFTLPAELLELVSKQGFDIFPELIQVIINTAMQNDCKRVKGIIPLTLPSIFGEIRYGHL
ncbi:MAG: hypothetical protein Q8N46_00930 [Anaerolineales bacterium]|nr:hypothetical protein [Anaerolineales bacterium]